MSTRLSNVILAAALAALACAAHARAQTQTPTPTPAPQQPAAVEDVDLAITARVTARELRFEKVPNPKVEFTGKPRRETLWQTERENLPDEVRPGVTYRDIGIRLRITSVFADIDRIVAEALGEKPLTDEPPPAPQPQNEPQPQSAPTPPADDERGAVGASIQGSAQVTAQDMSRDATSQPQPQSRRTNAAPAPRASLNSPAAAPATNKTTRQRRGTTREGRHR